MVLCYGISCICFLAFVNVMYVTRCNEIKSGIVLRFEEIAFYSEIMAVCILGYDVISISVYNTNRGDSRGQYWFSIVDDVNAISNT